jgi:hypothetical protein
MSLTGITVQGGVSIGPGVQVGATAYTFTLQSTDFSSGSNWTNGTVAYPEPQGVNGTAGFIVDLSNIPPDNTNDQYASVSPYIMNNLTNSTLSTFFNNLSTNNIVSLGQPTLWNVTWGAGSSITNGVAQFSGATLGSTMYVATVDTSIPGWDTNPNGYTTKMLAGTFMLPATFTLIVPVDVKSGWC